MTSEELEIIYQATELRMPDRELAVRLSRPLGNMAQQFIDDMTDAEVQSYLREYVQIFRRRVGTRRS